MSHLLSIVNGDRLRDSCVVLCVGAALLFASALIGCGRSTSGNPSATGGAGSEFTTAGRSVTSIEQQRLRERMLDVQRQMAEKWAEFNRLATRSTVDGWVEPMPTPYILYGSEWKEVRHGSLGATPDDLNKFDSLVEEIEVLQKQFASLEQEARRMGISVPKLPTCDQCGGIGQDFGYHAQWERDADDGRMVSKQVMGWRSCPKCEGRGVWIAELRHDAASNAAAQSPTNNGIDPAQKSLQIPFVPRTPQVPKDEDLLEGLDLTSYLIDVQAVRNDEDPLEELDLTVPRFDDASAEDALSGLDLTLPDRLSPVPHPTATGTAWATIAVLVVAGSVSFAAMVFATVALLIARSARRNAAALATNPSGICQHLS